MNNIAIVEKISSSLYILVFGITGNKNDAR